MEATAPYTEHQRDALAGDTEEDVAGKIFIGGLSWQTSEQTLKAHFERYGELTDVALMYDKRTNKPRGFGFVKMRDPAAAEAVLHDEHTIDGRLVDVKLALPRDRAPGPAGKVEICKLFIGGLPHEVDDARFREYFSKFGTIKDAIVMVDRNTGTSRGFGFVTYDAEDAVQQVMSRSHEFDGKVVEIKRAEPRDAVRGSGGGGNAGAGAGGYDPYGGGGSYQRRDVRSGRDGGRYGGNNSNNNRPSPYGGNNDGDYQQQYYRNPYGGPSRGNNNNPYGGASNVNTGSSSYRGSPYTAMPTAGVPPHAAPAGYGYASPAPMMAYYDPSAAVPVSVPTGYGYAAPAGASVAGDQGNDQKGYDVGALAAEYANAAMQMRGAQAPPTYGYAMSAGPAKGYGSGGAYGYTSAPPMMPSNPQQQQHQQQHHHNQQHPSDGYGAYRGQAAADSRAGRSYRPY